jgi:hypothetical protein
MNILFILLGCSIYDVPGIRVTSLFPFHLAILRAVVLFLLKITDKCGEQSQVIEKLK